MKRPEWVPEPRWERLEAALSGHPAHAEDALADLTELTAEWDDPTRLRMVEAFLKHAACGLSPIAAMARAVSDLLEGDDG
jgi:hypothetical protein